ncbi:hypothetical protein EVAR_30660_1 [Eumeta japonica]|uniref:Uncharacterized protein n=1 Tax=Eumeta variegata TaxID=151549 RepID=A0A4C1VS86_EUMVA|nr:hypothetical protein EVAR_30660_1 [Eumeta japonica]
MYSVRIRKKRRPVIHQRNADANNVASQRGARPRQHIKANMYASIGVLGVDTARVAGYAERLIDKSEVRL